MRDHVCNLTHLYSEVPFSSMRLTSSSACIGSTAGKHQLKVLVCRTILRVFHYLAHLHFQLLDCVKWHWQGTYIFCDQGGSTQTWELNQVSLHGPQESPQDTPISKPSLHIFLAHWNVFFNCDGVSCSLGCVYAWV